MSPPPRSSRKPPGGLPVVSTAQGDPRWTAIHREPSAHTAREQLAHALAGADSALSREVVCDVVTRLEQSAGASLGATDHDALVLLQRRAARAISLLDRAGSVPPDDVLIAMTADLLDPVRALQRAAAAMHR